MKPSLYSIETCPIGSLFIMPKPSGEWLEEDIGHYKMQGITDVVSLLRSDEVAELNLTDEECYCRKVSIDFVRFPIQDRGLPDLNSLKNLALESAKLLKNERSLAIHCRAGIDRAGLLSCCILQELGLDAVEAIKGVSDARGVTVPDTIEQREFILNYMNR